MNISEITSREGIINTHSLVWNQFSSENYTDTLRYAWHDTDPHFSMDEMSTQPRPRVVLKIQFDYKVSKCQHYNRSRPAAIQCSHYGKVLCMKHLLERVCFHDVNGERAGPSGVDRRGPSHDTDSDEDDDFGDSAFRHRTSN